MTILRVQTWIEAGYRHDIPRRQVAIEPGGALKGVGHVGDAEKNPIVQ